MILEEEPAQTILYALATGYRDRAANVAFERADVPLEDREDLVALLLRAPDDSTAARLFGDWVRAHDGDASIVNEAYRIAFYRGPWWKQQTQSPMTRYFFGNKAGRPLDKWPHYFPIYERYLHRFAGTSARILEIGVFRAGGLDLLADYFGPDAHVVGMDIDETARELADPRFPVFIGDQSDPDDLRRLNEEHGPFDIIIDDGGHTVNQQITSAEVLFPLLNDAGVYLIEDVHTSYWEQYQDAGDRNLLDWTRERMDDVNAYHHSRDAELSHWQLHLRSIHVYDSVVVMEKGVSYAPFSEVAGAKEFARPRRERDLVDLELVATRDAALAQRDAARRETDEVRALAAEAQARAADAQSQVAESVAELAAVRADLERAASQLEELRHSRSWRVTAPLRRVSEKGRE